jgi:hypothetical protein
LAPAVSAPQNQPNPGRRGVAERHRRTAVGLHPNLDIWRAANLLIRGHGAGADLEAARLQDLMFDRTDDEGRVVWARIRRTIEALRAPQSGEPN